MPATPGYATASSIPEYPDDSASVSDSSSANEACMRLPFSALKLSELHNWSSAEKSRLYQKLAAREMPPGNALKPTDTHVATIKTWIDAGASDRKRSVPQSASRNPKNAPRPDSA